MEPKTPLSPNPRVEGDSPTSEQWEDMQKIKAKDASEALRRASDAIRPFLEAD